MCTGACRGHDLHALFLVDVGLVWSGLPALYVRPFIQHTTIIQLFHFCCSFRPSILLMITPKTTQKTRPRNEMFEPRLLSAMVKLVGHSLRPPHSSPYFCLLAMIDMVQVVLFPVCSCLSSMVRFVCSLGHDRQAHGQGECSRFVRP